MISNCNNCKIEVKSKGKWIKKYCNECGQKIRSERMKQNNPMKNLKSRIKISLKNKGKTHICSKETKRKISLGNTGKIRSEEVKQRISNTVTKTMKERFDKYPFLHPNRILASRNRRTFIEKVMKQELEKNNIQFEEQKRIGRRYADFCINDLIVECDGERFHDKIEDRKRDLELQLQGYRILHFKANDITYNTQKCIDILINNLIKI